MESFARAVEIVLKESELKDAPGYFPSQPCGPTPYNIAAIFSPAMPPEACLPKRNAKALKPPRLPILTFDEWQLRLALDGVFNVTWLMPGESLLSILWKFACANALPGHILHHLVCPHG